MEIMHMLQSKVRRFYLPFDVRTRGKMSLEFLKIQRHFGGTEGWEGSGMGELINR
jgi:hypothetical protein